MAFTDMPQIDEASKNSDKSNVKLLSLFSQSNGFIAREDIPDKGCDYDVELILNGKNASNWRFAIQLKSIATLNLIEEGEIVSYPFETSRLGYLIRRNPGMGIIAIYSNEHDCIFYDHVENIYKTINEERDDESWMAQKTVNIKISANNKIDVNSIKSIHEYYVTRFKNASVMQKSHGAKYGLPVIPLESASVFDFNNPDDIVNALKKFGVGLLSSYDLDMVYSLVSKLSMPLINSSKEIQIIAAVAYCEAGKHAEASYYFDRLNRRYDIADYEKQMIDFAKLKNDLALGKLNWAEFDNKCKELKDNTDLTVNDITLDINLHYLSILRLSPFVDVPVDLISAIENNFNRIDSLDTKPSTKNLLEAWNLDNYSMVLGCIRTRAYQRQRTRDAMKLPMSLEERGDAVLKLVGAEQMITSRLGSLQEKAKANDDKLLRANLNLTFNRHFLSHEIEQISFRVGQFKGDRFNIALHHLEQATIGYQLFFEQSRYKEAYQSICHALEFVILLEEYYHISDIPFKDQVVNSVALLEKELELPPYQPVFHSIIEKANLSIGESQEASVEHYKDMTDEEIVYTAGLVMEALKLPEERLKNIILEMEAQRLFYRRCTNPILKLFIYDPLRNEHNRYEKPTRFVIRSESTKIETSPSSDMETLLGQWRM